jgi:hypothetical protein
MASDSNINPSCFFEGARTCFVTFSIGFLYVLLYIITYIVPSVSEIWPLVVYRDDPSKFILILLIHSILIMIFTAIVSVKFAMELRYPHAYEDRWSEQCCNYERAICVGPPKNLISGGNWFLCLIPWFICNFFSMLTFNNQLGDGSVEIILLTLSPLVILPFFMGIGCAIMGPVNEYRHRQWSEFQRSNKWNRSKEWKDIESGWWY